MAYTLGKPGCPKCSGKGVYPGEPVKRVGFDGVEKIYETVIRCSCLEAKHEAEIPPGKKPAETKPDAASRAAGEKEEA